MTTLPPLTLSELSDLKAKAKIVITRKLDARTDGSTILRLIDMIERRDVWQPIETAPKDGTYILVAGGTVHNHDDSTFPYDGPHTGVSVARWRRNYPECWVGDTLEGHDCFQEVKPTHWQPLPAPPSEASAATEPK